MLLFRHPAAFAGLILLLPVAAWAHGVEAWIERGDAIRVHFSSDHGGPMVDAGFRVFTSDGREVFARGHTDALGRAVFSPNQAGTWRVLMASEDGHGAEVEIPVSAEELAGATPARPAPVRVAGAIPAGSTAAGIGYLLGIAGLLVLLTRRNP
ncbi:MAG: hypothetical protein ACPGJE_06425 [Wenzhouxiangellaceae bacterium]